MSLGVGFSFRRFRSSASVRSSRRACASAASLASRAALCDVVSLMMRPRKRVFGLALFAGLSGDCLLSVLIPAAFDVVVGRNKRADGAARTLKI